MTFLNEKPRAALRNSLSEVQILTIDVLSMVSSDLQTDVDLILGAIFMMIREKTFAGVISYKFNKITIRDWGTDCHTWLSNW